MSALDIFTWMVIALMAIFAIMAILKIIEWGLRILIWFDKIFTKDKHHKAYDVPSELEFFIEYSDANGVITERTISPKSIKFVDKNDTLIYATCFLRHENRNFRNSRIMECRNLKTNREIKDLGNYLRNLV